jgi:hypothetical protein
MGALIAWMPRADAKSGRLKEVSRGRQRRHRRRRRLFGTLGGWFKAADARTGRELWKFKVGSSRGRADFVPRRRWQAAHRLVCRHRRGQFLLSGDVRSDDPADVRPPADRADLARL